MSGDQRPEDVIDALRDGQSLAEYAAEHGVSEDELVAAILVPFKERLAREQRQVACPNCGETRALELAGWSAADPTNVELCALCGCRHLYRQRDFNRALGCALVLVGAVLVPWTYGLSLLVLALVDLILYYRLPESVVCYGCDTVYRDARPAERQGEFDLLKHDVLKYGKSWQELDLAEH